MVKTSIIDHNLLIDTILSQNGIIVGGYVRAWVSNGAPSDQGWEDIDCIFQNFDDAKIAIKNIKNLFGVYTPEIDLRVSKFGPYSHLRDIKSISLKFNTFYSSCWKFDGEMKLLEPAESYSSYEKVFHQTKNKIAQCIMPFNFYKKNPRQIAKMLKYGWTVIDDKEREIKKEILLDIIKNCKSTYYPTNNQFS